MSDEKKQNVYSPEFKKFVARQVILDGKKITDVAEGLSLPYGTLKRWVSDLRKEQLLAEKDRQQNLLTASEYKELLEKERRLRQDAEEEVAILKKAMHIFSQDRM